MDYKIGHRAHILWFVCPCNSVFVFVTQGSNRLYKKKGIVKNNQQQRIEKKCVTSFTSRLCLPGACLVARCASWCSLKGFDRVSLVQLLKNGQGWGKVTWWSIWNHNVLIFTALWWVFCIPSFHITCVQKVLPVSQCYRNTYQVKSPVWITQLSC